MKLRIKDNSIRLRLTRSEVERLADVGEVSARTQFGPSPGNEFVYTIKRSASHIPATASFLENLLVVSVSESACDEWLTTDRVGIDSDQDNGRGGLKILIEKDFACLAERPGEDDSDAFPNPGPSSACSAAG